MNYLILKNNFASLFSGVFFHPVSFLSETTEIIQNCGAFASPHNRPLNFFHEWKKAKTLYFADVDLKQQNCPHLVVLRETTHRKWKSQSTQTKNISQKRFVLMPTRTNNMKDASNLTNLGSGCFFFLVFFFVLEARLVLVWSSLGRALILYRKDRDALGQSNAWNARVWDGRDVQLKRRDCSNFRNEERGSRTRERNNGKL